MKTLETVQHAGPDCLLRLTIPVEEPNRSYRIVVVYEPEQAIASPSTALGWPEGYFEQTAGSITDETFVRPSMGEDVERLSLE